jgi:hypothetical protein
MDRHVVIDLDQQLIGFPDGNETPHMCDATPAALRSNMLSLLQRLTEVYLHSREQEKVCGPLDRKEIVNSVYRYPTTGYLVCFTIPRRMCGATHNNLICSRAVN